MNSRDGAAIKRVALIIAVMGLAAASAAARSPSQAALRAAQSPAVERATVTSSATSGVPIRKLLTIVIENHTLEEMQAGMPYLNRLSWRSAYAAHYHAIRHPSLPNYLAIAGGSTFGISTNDPPRSNAARVGRARSVFGQALGHGRTAKVYAESMPRNCATASSGLYAVKHNPWPYFRTERAMCKRFNVPAGTPTSGALAHDVARGRLPHLSMLIPNLCNDAHDCPLATADRWLRDWLPSLMHSRDFRLGRLAIVVTADEGSPGHYNRVLTVVLHRGGESAVVLRRLNHYSLSRLYSQVAHAKPMRHARGAVGMRAPFGI